MKKILIMLLVSMLVVTCGACSNSANENSKAVSKEEKAEIEYYPNSTVPTLESLMGETLIDGGDGNYLYGTYDTETEGRGVMELYVSALVVAHGFSRNNTSVGYELTNGTETVTIIGGNYGDKLAICVMID